MRASPPRIQARLVRPVATLLVTFIAASAMRASDVRAQDVLPPTAVSPQVAASARSIAERAQEAFERQRRRLLPATRSGGQRCDVRVGRLCYWYDESEPPPPPEPEAVAGERRRLLATLDAAGRDAPADDLIVGQRVRYRLEAGQPDSALAIGRACTATAWWCAALRGWSLHTAGHAVGAEAAFDTALALMPPAERCRWTDISLLLVGGARGRYADLPCEARASLERRAWWLATPFYVRGANDRRNEHFARLAFARLASESSTTYRMRWSGDLHELLVRYGWADHWTRREAPPMSSSIEESVVGHEPVPAYAWLPDASLLDDPYAATAASWVATDPRARERYAPRAPRRLGTLTASVARFRRGDSLRVVATYRRPAGAPADTGGALALAREERPPILAPLDRDSAGGVAVATIASAAHLLSLELFGDSTTAWRTRFAVRPPDGAAATIAISDLLPFVPATDGDTTMAAAIAGAVRGSQIHTPAPLAIYWELYDVPTGRQQLEMVLRMSGDRPGWLVRAWDRVRGATPEGPPNLRWTDIVSSRAGEPVGRVVALHLPPLSPGRYRLELSVRNRATGESVVRTRELHVQP